MSRTFQAWHEKFEAASLRGNMIGFSSLMRLIARCDEPDPFEKGNIDREELVKLRRQCVVEELLENPRIIIEAARAVGMKVEPA